MDDPPPPGDDGDTAGEQPYDALNGFRVGALAGAVVGVVLTFLLGIGAVWLILFGGAVGGVGGYIWEERRGP